MLNTLINSPYCESIVAVGRRENIEHKSNPKLKQYIVTNMLEISSMNPSIAEDCNVAFACIGTPFYDVFNRKKAKEFHRTDFGITTEFAKYARVLGIEFFATITGQGTDSQSKTNMYRVKGEVEDFVKTLGFKHVSFLRPGLLNRGSDATLVEKVMSVGGLLGLSVKDMAQAMVWMALKQSEPLKAYTSKEIKEISKRFNHS